MGGQQSGQQGGSGSDLDWSESDQGNEAEQQNLPGAGGTGSDQLGGQGSVPSGVAAGAGGGTAGQGGGMGDTGTMGDAASMGVTGIGDAGGLGGTGVGGSQQADISSSPQGGSGSGSMSRGSDQTWGQGGSGASDLGNSSQDVEGSTLGQGGLGGAGG